MVIIYNLRDSIDVRFHHTVFGGNARKGELTSHMPPESITRVNFRMPVALFSLAKLSVLATSSHIDEAIRPSG
jgi:hypothetical protein